MFAPARRKPAAEPHPDGELGMGAWGSGTFENDTANDWVYELERVDDLSAVRAAFADVLDAGDDYLDSDPASMALAACEVIARLRGKGGPSGPWTESVDGWVRGHPQPVPDELVRQAEAVIDRVLGPDSELADLWDESGPDEWRAAVADLRSRACG